MRGRLLVRTFEPFNGITGPGIPSHSAWRPSTCNFRLWTHTCKISSLKSSASNFATGRLARVEGGITKVMSPSQGWVKSLSHLHDGRRATTGSHLQQLRHAINAYAHTIHNHLLLHTLQMDCVLLQISHIPMYRLKWRRKFLGWTEDKQNVGWLHNFVVTNHGQTWHKRGRPQPLNLFTCKIPSMAVGVQLDCTLPIQRSWPELK